MFLPIICLKLKHVFHIKPPPTAQIGIIVFVNIYNLGYFCNVLRYAFLYSNYVLIYKCTHYTNLW